MRTYAAITTPCDSVAPQVCMYLLILHVYDVTIIRMSTRKRNRQIYSHDE